MVNLQQLLVDIGKMGADPNLPTTLAAVKSLVAQPSFTSVLTLVKDIEADPVLLSVVSDLTPTRLQIIAALKALGLGQTSPTAAPAA